MHKNARNIQIITKSDLGVYRKALGRYYQMSTDMLGFHSFPSIKRFDLI